MTYNASIDLIGTGYDYDNGKFLGVTYNLPKLPDEKDIIGYNLPSAKQRWVRPILPTDYEIKSYSEESKLEIITRELLRRKNGLYFFNNGIPTYITGGHYFYLTYWYMAALTKDGYPQYRWSNALTEYFIDYCEKDENSFGAIMLMNKRDGKTERSISHIYNTATLLEHDCDFGMQSLNSTEAKNNLFKGRLMRSHKMIANYLKPVSNETNSSKEIMSELRFMGDKDKEGNYKNALNNKIDWRPTLVSAYQGKRPRNVFLDEPGTVEEMDIELWWSTLREQLAYEDIIFGKAFLPTTLETMTNKGAVGFKNIWDKSDFNERDANNRTKSGLYRYFKPYYYGRMVDDYGNDQVEEAKIFRENYLANASIEDARKYKRQYPATEAEAFDSIKADKSAMLCLFKDSGICDFFNRGENIFSTSAWLFSNPTRDSF